MNTSTVRLKIFDDVRREFVEREIDLSEVTDIATKVTTHYGVKGGFQCVRAGMTHGRWIYVSAEQIDSVRALCGK